MALDEKIPVLTDSNEIKMSALEDNKTKLFQKAAQQIIADLCEANNVPTIPVIYTKQIGLLIASAAFYPKLWEIHITSNTDAHALVHEFTHYIVELCSIADTLNENLTERAALYYEWEMKFDKKTKNEKMKKMLDNFDSQYLEMRK